MVFRGILIVLKQKQNIAKKTWDRKGNIFINENIISSGRRQYFKYTTVTDRKVEEVTHEIKKEQEISLIIEEELGNATSK